jgi:hypothetical protein
MVSLSQQGGVSLPLLNYVNRQQAREELQSYKSAKAYYDQAEEPG